MAWHVCCMQSSIPNFLFQSHYLLNMVYSYISFMQHMNILEMEEKLSLSLWWRFIYHNCYFYFRTFMFYILLFYFYFNMAAKTTEWESHYRHSSLTLKLLLPSRWEAKNVTETQKGKKQKKRKNRKNRCKQERNKRNAFRLSMGWDMQKVTKY